MFLNFQTDIVSRLKLVITLFHRVPKYCKKCTNVSKFDVIDALDMNVDIFMDEYAITRKLLQVKNVTNNWRATSAFSFE